MSGLASPELAPLADDAPHLLVIDDDQRIRTLLSRYLTDNGFRVDVAANAAEARSRLAGMTFDLLVLDVMMPGESGVELLRSLRQSMDVPILMLTARAEIEHRIIGLEGGADDYLGKPFEPRELVLRINAILKRGAPAAPAPLIEQLRFGPFTFHIGRRELKRGQEVIRLTDRERQIMAVFAATPNDTVPRLSLLAEDEPAGERTIDVQINRLRRKIEIDPANPLYLQTVRGVGYRLVTEA
ncbi:response regulator [Kaistia dalseonensis]|uniref:Two-component system phosphate regulon response regulator OmpR n=1 Tax=Kaistia dalseonensis TaxID=410840 RepID=A0ABU0H636_9HYPH|nr:response regulator [Kaistia dalseonensis]MCX5495178.1 response regulator [Kaistia dalseonensis]MDQ0437762.1 two-component system phosphate regulon response regulator OmpR [Kaistia dalseonensis]